MDQEAKIFDMEAERRSLSEDAHFTEEEKAEILEDETTVKGLLIHKVYLKLNPLFNLEDRNSKVMAKLIVFNEAELDELYTFIRSGDKDKRAIEDKINEILKR